MHVHHGIDRDEIIEHLSRPSACVSPKYLYDPLGCKLFEAITCLPEYYPTRLEQGLLARYGEDIARRAGRGGVLVDLGAGNGEKAAALFPLLRPRQYLAVDFSVDFLRRTCARLQAAFPDIEMLALGADLARDWRLPGAVRAEPCLFFYPGSSIGNFHPDEALSLLRHVRSLCTGADALLIGIDLLKTRAALEAAYDDALGVTAAFNLNVLRHLNTLIGSNFELRCWRHQAAFNDDHSRMEMHLEAVEAHSVAWPGGDRFFCAGECIHTENSYKYRLEDFEALLVQAGFSQVSHWTDDRCWYGLCYAGL